MVSVIKSVPGYGVFQFRKAGYRAEGFEISVLRARFASKMGIKIETDLLTINHKFDAIYSGHVLEHVLNPKSVLDQQLELLNYEGYLVAHTTNGNCARRGVDFRGFHLHWGRVHPVLITEEFIEKNFLKFPFFISSEYTYKQIALWNGKGQHIGPLNRSELFIIIRKKSWRI